MDLEVAMAHQEAATVLEAVSVAVPHPLVGTVEDVAVMVPRDLDPEARLHLDMVPTLTTVLKVAWLLSSDSVPIPCKINLLEEDLRPAVARLLDRLSRWTSVLAVHLMRHPITSHLTV